MQVTGLVPVSVLVLTVFTAELKWLPEWLEYSVDVDQPVHCTAWQAVAEDTVDGSPRPGFTKRHVIVPVAWANQ